MDTPTSSNQNWYALWWNILAHPGVDSFKQVLRSPGAGPSLAYRWLAGSTLVSSSFSQLLYWILTIAYEGSGQTSSGIFSSLLKIVTTTFLTIILFAVCTRLLHWIAVQVGGTGSGDGLLVCYAAISGLGNLTNLAANLLVLPVLFLLLTSTQDPAQVASVRQWILGAYELALGIYTFILAIHALRAAENLSKTDAVIALFFSFLILLGVISVPFFVLQIWKASPP